MKTIFFTWLTIMLLGFNTLAIEGKSSSSMGAQFYGTASTAFPLFAGGGIGMIYASNFDLRLSYGQTPQSYYKFIGEAAASSGENEAYKDVIESAFYKNSLAKIDFDYHYESIRTGWVIGGSFYYLKSKGQAEIDQVLGAATGRDYTALKNLLIAAGRSTEVEMDSTLYISEIHIGYNWNLINRLILSSSLGVAKVTGADVNLKTGLPNFEASQAGSNLMRQSESDLEDILKDQGATASIALNLKYLF